MRLPGPPLSDMKIRLGNKLKTEGEESRVKLKTSMFAVFDSHSAVFLPLGSFVFLDDNDDIQTQKMSAESPDNNLLRAL